MVQLSGFMFGMTQHSLSAVAQAEALHMACNAGSTGSRHAVAAGMHSGSTARHAQRLEPRDLEWAYR